MTQKNSENIYKALKEEERTLLEKNVTWMEIRCIITTNITTHSLMQSN